MLLVVIVVVLVVVIVFLAITNVSLVAKSTQVGKTFQKALRRHVVDVAHSVDDTARLELKQVRISSAIAALDVLSRVAGGDRALSNLTTIDVDQLAATLDKQHSEVFTHQEE
jgi:hypothetical protein